MTSESVVNLALLGAGVFARDAYLPLLRYVLTAIHQGT